MGGRRGQRATGFHKEQHPGPGNEEELRWLRSVSVKGKPGLSSRCATPKLHPVLWFSIVNKHPLWLVGLHPYREQ